MDNILPTLITLRINTVGGLFHKMLHLFSCHLKVYWTYTKSLINRLYGCTISQKTTQSAFLVFTKLRSQLFCFDQKIILYWEGVPVRLLGGVVTKALYNMYSLCGCYTDNRNLRSARLYHASPVREISIHIEGYFTLCSCSKLMRLNQFGLGFKKKFNPLGF